LPPRVRAGRRPLRAGRGAAPGTRWRGGGVVPAGRLGELLGRCFGGRASGWGGGGRRCLMVARWVEGGSTRCGLGGKHGMGCPSFSMADCAGGSQPDHPAGTCVEYTAAHPPRLDIAALQLTPHRGGSAVRLKRAGLGCGRGRRSTARPSWRGCRRAALRVGFLAGTSAPPTDLHCGRVPPAVRGRLVVMAGPSNRRSCTVRVVPA